MQGIKSIALWMLSKLSTKCGHHQYILLKSLLTYINCSKSQDSLWHVYICIIYSYHICPIAILNSTELREATALYWDGPILLWHFFLLKLQLGPFQCIPWLFLISMLFEHWRVCLFVRPIYFNSMKHTVFSFVLPLPWLVAIGIDYKNPHSTILQTHWAFCIPENSHNQICVLCFIKPVLSQARCCLAIVSELSLPR